MASSVIHATDANFPDVVLRHEGLVIVDFWAPWCGPCRILGPTIETLANELAGRVRFVKVNVDEEPRLAEVYAISSIPTLKFFLSGREVAQLVGAPPPPALRSAIETVLARASGAGEKARA